MLVQMDDKKLEKQNRYVMKLIDLMREHPNLPVMAMVDSEVVQDDCCAWWDASFTGEPHLSKLCVNNYSERLVCWDDDTDLNETFENCGFDYDDCGITDDMSDEEVNRIMEQKISEFDWLLCIIAPIGIPDPIIPGNGEIYRPTKHEQFENLRERVKKYREAAERTEKG